MSGRRRGRGNPQAEKAEKAARESGKRESRQAEADGGRRQPALPPVLWSPQPKQAEFLRRPEYEALYGGAAGGGKSDALLVEALRQVHIPHYSALILRKTYPQLAELIERSRALYQQAFPGARYNAGAHAWTFPSGAKVWFGSMHRRADRENYRGKAYDYIAFDELTHFTWEEYSFMFSRNRPKGPGTRVYIRATANPGGVGHQWVKERFVTAAPPLTPIRDVYRVTAPDGKTVEMTRDRVFVPATVFDNRILLDNDPGYLANLSMLPEAERRAFLYGDWDSFAGQVFREWRDDPAHYIDRRRTHVIEGFLLPETWRIFRGFDFGYARPFAALWFAVDHDGRMYLFRELYGTTGQPNEGIRWEPRRIAREIARIESEDPNIRGRRVTGIADPAIFDSSRGESIAEMMEREGVFFDPGDNKRLPGKMEMHYRLAFGEDGRPMLYVFKHCRNFIRTVPTLAYSETDPEDVDTDGEDHCYDAARYVLMANPIAPQVIRELSRREYNPLEDDVNYSARYDWYSVRP